MSQANRSLRVLLLHVGAPSSFIQRDIDLLRTCHKVRPVRVDRPGAVAAALLAVRRADVVFCWFGSLRFLPWLVAARALGRPVVIVAGGYDLASLPEIGYGNMRPGVMCSLGRLVFRLADIVVCVSVSAASEATANAGVPGRRVRVIPNAFETERLGDTAEPAAKEPLVLTVAVIDPSTLRRKGLLTVARTSRLLPDTKFVVAGKYDPGARAAMVEVGGPNLVLPGYVSDAELDRLYRTARVYFQPSLHEAFGCSVAEAMLHDCVPVVTRRFGLPEVVGPSGVYVEPEDPAGSAEAIRSVLGGAGPSLSPREQIVKRFPLSHRREQLLRLLDEVIEPDRR